MTAKTKTKTNSAQPPGAFAGLRNLMRSLARRLGGTRDYNEALGYPALVSPEDMAHKFKRNGLAGRIVRAYPNACWRTRPALVPADPSFLKAWDALDQSVGLWSKLRQADIAAGKGHFGLIVFGLKDGLPLSTPVNMQAHRPTGLAYLRVVSEENVQVSSVCTDATSPRYGAPEMYQITVETGITAGGTATVVNVHHSRVLHIAEDCTDNQWLGTSRLEQVWDRLIDLDKLLGGSAEIYWQNAAAFYHMNIDPDAEWDDEAAEELKAQWSAMQDGLERVIRTRGVQLDQKAPGLMGSDPKNSIDAQVDHIAGALGIPKRILLGSEAGELASSQDGENWADRVHERNEQHVVPFILLRFITHLQEYGLLPGGTVRVDWAKSGALSPTKQAELATATANAIATYANAIDAERLMSVAELRERLGLKGSAPADQYDVDPARPDSEDIDSGALDANDPAVADQFARGRGGPHV